MKKALINLISLTMLALVTGCNNANNPAGTSSEPLNDSSSLESSEVSTTSESSIQSSSSSAKDYVDNQLSTESGLKVNFEATGAKISSINWGTKQIASNGFTVGRVAGRIAQGKFTLNGKQYNIGTNNNGNSLHGGGTGDQWNGPFANARWTKDSQTSSTITYKYTSPAGESGFPGKMEMTVVYSLTQNGELSIEYTATTTADTLCNPTNHLYININAANNYNNIKLWVFGDNYTPLNSNDIPTGDVSPVEGTKFDYRTEKSFNGSESYDHNYVLNTTEGEDFRKVATLTGTSSKIKVDVYTDRPGMQLYKENSGKICLETQMLPDAINHPEFDAYGTTILRAGETFRSKTTYHFSQIQ